MELPQRLSAGVDVLAEIADKGDLPAAAQAIQRLHQMKGRDDYHNDELARVILEDPGLCSKVLRVVNSPFYRRSGEPVTTISRAVLLLGFNTISDVTSGLLLVEHFMSNGDANPHLVANLKRSVRCGIAAQALARKAGLEAAEQSYLLGLFANLAVLWLAAYYRSELESIQASEAEGQNVDEAIEQQLGFNPNVLTARILEYWALPTPFVQHFRRRKPGAAPPSESERKMSRLVDLADRYSVTKTLELGPVDAVIDALIDTFGLSAKDLDETLRAVEETFEEQAAVLGL